MALGLGDTSAEKDNQDGVLHDPKGCYYEGGALKWNEEMTNNGNCSSSEVCLCSYSMFLPVGLTQCDLPPPSTVPFQPVIALAGDRQAAAFPIPIRLTVKSTSARGRILSRAFDQPLARIGDSGGAYTMDLLHLCLRYATACQGDACAAQRQAKPFCRTLVEYDAHHGFELFVQGTVRVQITLVEPAGLSLGVTDVLEVTVPQETDVLSRAEYFEKFAAEEREHPFGGKYYGLFAVLIRELFAPDTVSAAGQRLYISRAPNSDAATLGETIRQHGFRAVHDISSSLAITAAEIGLARGGHSSTILHDLEPTLLKTLYGVDPFLAYYDDLDIFAQKRQAEFDAMHDFVRQRLADEEAARYGASATSRFTLLRQPSVEGAHNGIPPTVPVHAVFIDGDHQAQSVMDDLEAWFPRVVSGGLIVGDDYHLETVERGVNMFLEKLPPGTPRPTVFSVSRPISPKYRLFAFVKPSMP